MTTTSCFECGIEIELEISPQIPEGHVCFKCHADYIIQTKQPVDNGN